MSSFRHSKCDIYEQHEITQDKIHRQQNKLFFDVSFLSTFALLPFLAQNVVVLDVINNFSCDQLWLD